LKQELKLASDHEYRFEGLRCSNGAGAAVTLETWECYGCFLQNTDYGDLNYATNEPATVALTIVYDNAMHTPDAVGVVGIGTAGAARSTSSALSVGSAGI
jgi:hypothetical protein